MVLDAIDECLRPLSENLVIIKISCSEQRFVEQVEKDKIGEFKLYPVRIYKLCHEDHSTTKEDFDIGLTKIFNIC